MSVCRRQKKNVKGLLFCKTTDFKRCVPAPPVRAATVPTPVRTRIRRAYIACTQIARAPATPPVSSLRTTRTLALTHRAAHTEHRPTHSPRTTRAHSTTRIRRHLPAVPPAPAVPVPVGCRPFRFPRAPHRTPNNTFPPRISRLSDEVLKLRTFSFFAKQFKLCGQLTELK